MCVCVCVCTNVDVNVCIHVCTCVHVCMCVSVDLGQSVCAFFFQECALVSFLAILMCVDEESKPAMHVIMIPPCSAVSPTTCWNCTFDTGVPTGWGLSALRSQLRQGHPSSSFDDGTHAESTCGSQQKVGVRVFLRVGVWVCAREREREMCGCGCLEH